MIIDNSSSRIVEDLYHISSFAEELHYAIDQYNNWKKEEEKCYGFLKNRKRYTTLGVVLFLIGTTILIILSVLVDRCVDEKSMNFFWYDPSLDIYIVFGVIGIIVSLILIFVSIYAFIRGTVISSKKDKLKQKAVKNKEFFKSEIEKYMTSGAYTMQKDIYVTYFPDCKARKSDIDYLILVMQTGRATTFKEALILLDKKKYNDEMKEIVEKTMEYAKKAAEKPVSTSTTTVQNIYYNR